ncbi:MAG TPA: NAD(P)H-binding protein, partial [Ktedonobacteraceae bacterium]|nr:NAD(P)H-binding protein [Ktedonobacteraceae bacterium]
MRRNLATPLLRKPREKLSFTRSHMIMKTILVTGATGKVGSHFVPRLLQREQNVRLLVRRAQQAEAFQRGGAEAIVGDLSQPESL